MIQWSKLPADVQKTILTLVVMSGGISATSGCCPVICDPLPPPTVRTLPSPMICDPPPPPSISPTRFKTPVIFDPAPSPAITRTPRATSTPVICDPMPPPGLTRTPRATSTPVPTSRYQLRSLQMTVDSTLKGAAVRGSVYDASNQPLGDVKVTLKAGNTTIDTTTARNGSFFIRVAEPGSYELIVGEDTSSAISIVLHQYDVAITDWTEIRPQSQAPLPLAEIRTVDILWGNDLTFGIETSWPGARYRWSVTGGTLIEESNRVTWQPPSGPGRYLMQLVADWGREGLAVDSIVLDVNADGTIIVS